MGGSERPHIAVIMLSKQPDLARNALRAVASDAATLSAVLYLNGGVTLDDYDGPQPEWWRAGGGNHILVAAADEPFSYSKMNNRAASIALMETAHPCDYLLFLNDDVTMRPDSVDAMLTCARRQHAEVVGINLAYPPKEDEPLRIQHAGVIPGAFFVGCHRGRHSLLASWAYSYPRWLTMWAVTGACMLVEANTFAEVNGFDEEYEVDQQDIDLCMRVRTVLNGTVALVQGAFAYHDEGATRGRDEGMLSARAKDQARFVGLWYTQWNEGRDRWR